MEALSSEAKGTLSLQYCGKDKSNYRINEMEV